MRLSVRTLKLGLQMLAVGGLGVLCCSESPNIIYEPNAQNDSRTRSLLINHFKCSILPQRHTPPPHLLNTQCIINWTE